MKGKNVVIFFIEMELDQEKLMSQNFNDLINYIEMPANVIYEYLDDNTVEMVALGHSTPYIGGKSPYVGRDITFLPKYSHSDILQIAHNKISENLTKVYFIAWGAVEEYEKINNMVDFFTHSQIKSMRSQVYLNLSLNDVLELEESEEPKIH